MKKIPSAEAFGIMWEEATMNALGTDKQGTEEVSLAHFFREFAKLHVQKALEKAAENSYCELRNEGNSDDQVVNKQSILNSYSLDNIK